MDAVHARRHEHFVQEPLEADRQAQIAVMEEGVRLEDQFVNGKGPAGKTDDAHLHNAKNGRHRHFAKVKPETGGNIEIGVDVVDVVKPPEKRDLVIDDMPIVKSEVHEKEAERELKWRGQRHEMDHAKGFRVRPVQSRQRCRSHQDSGDKKCEG